MGKIDDLTGQRFGRLTVEMMIPERSGRYVQYACRCDCGQIIYANGKQLKRGTKKGCPDCVRSSCSRDVNLVGLQYGELTVLERWKTREDGRAQWRCLCSCGNETIVTTAELNRGKVKTCRQGKHKPHAHNYEDLIGQRFGWLTVEAPYGEKYADGRSRWICRCKCGTECIQFTYELKGGKAKSCGCYSSEVLGPRLHTYLHTVNGTMIETLTGQKRRNNTSGYTGVAAKGKRWRASITFQRKQYNLGVYDDIQDAAKAWERAHEMRLRFVEWYAKEFPAEYMRIRADIRQKLNVPSQVFQPQDDNAEGAKE